MMFVMRIFVAAMAVFALFSAAFLGWCYREAVSDPLVRHARIGLPGLDRPLKVALLSDMHIGSATMGAERLARIVAQVNALKPDLVVIAGDFIFDVPGSAAKLGAPMVGPLSDLDAPLGVLAVPGNHDHATGLETVRAQLARAGVTLLANDAVPVGPIALGGVDDDASGHADVAATLRAARAIGLPILLFTHSPDIAPDLPADVPLLLAGHTHCGQVVLFGQVIAPEVSRFGRRYTCGLVREGARTVVVTAGLGTSEAPFRIGASPDLWLLTLVPVAIAPSRKAG
jgi:uncharacterized protein